MIAIGNSVKNSAWCSVAVKKVNSILGTVRKGTESKAGTIVYCYINPFSPAFWIPCAVDYW